MILFFIYYLCEKTSNMPLVSVILPVFNAERTISKCIGSVLSQTLHDFELIIINDGSTDLTLSICEEFILKDNRIIVLNQENRGVSYARNRGIEKASGKYLCFVDSDDWVGERYLKAFFKDGEIAEKEIVFQDCIEESEGRSSIKCNFQVKEYNSSRLSEVFNEQRLLNFGYPFCKLYRRDVIESHGIRFREDIFFIEDRIFLLEYIQYMESFRFSDEAHYHYTFSHGQESLTFRHNSFESEINAYYIEKGLLKSLTRQFSLNAEAVHYWKSCNGFLLYRALRTIYRPEWQKNFGERQGILREQYSEENIYCLRAYSRAYLGELLNRTAVRLYTHKCFYTYDLYTRFFIFIRYRMSFVWQIFRKVVKPVTEYRTKDHD
ncbi:glycosyltransferase family 2 protein [Dysgonomonas macrotermitis]|uniref:Glycosyltransferase involved in cell wall bisynthesis n=2 Tax=Dysgonomonas macrotermitis TaxID=1346286 RepID=A0A1M5EK98_9BACT|nr:glycosyltransferase family 2 protein [Dysgonomonas macrotermitis]SHF79540.1 Glycosyltransferase involved in cell wall bisynthesis [Dysgonomonas macrotermitis]